MLSVLKILMGFEFFFSLIWNAEEEDIAEGV